MGLYWFGAKVYRTTNRPSRFIVPNARNNAVFKFRKHQGDAVFLRDNFNWAKMGSHFDPWVALGLIADRTKRVLIGTGHSSIFSQSITICPCLAANSTSSFLSGLSQFMPLLNAVNILEALPLDVIDINSPPPFPKRNQCVVPAGI